MSRNNRQLEESIRRAVEAETPDVLPKVLLRIQEEEAAGTLTDPANPEVLPFPGRKAGRRGGWVRAVASAAAMVMLVFGFYMGHGRLAPQATISFDVNPSVQLTVNRWDKILSAQALNPDGQVILKDMDLKNVSLDVAVHALIGSMVKHGYISEIKNSILITVDSGSAEKGDALQAKLSQTVDGILSGYSLEGAVLSQSLSGDDRISQLAAQYGITKGKAVLVDQLVSQDDTLDFAGVAALPINDINLLIAARNTPLPGVQATGQASTDGYIGQDKALAIALAHATVARGDISKLEIDLDYDDGCMVYEVEFNTASAEYEYDIDAYSGDIVKYDYDAKQTSKPDDDRQGQAVSGSSATRLTKEQAKAIAYSHAGVQEADVRETEIELDEDDGRYIYEIKFKTASGKYEYELDAYSGAVLKNEHQAKKTAASSAQDVGRSHDNDRDDHDDRDD